MYRPRHNTFLAAFSSRARLEAAHAAPMGPLRQRLGNLRSATRAVLRPCRPAGGTLTNGMAALSALPFRISGNSRQSCSAISRFGNRFPGHWHSSRHSASWPGRWYWSYRLRLFLDCEALAKLCWIRSPIPRKARVLERLATISGWRGGLSRLPRNRIGELGSVSDLSLAYGHRPPVSPLLGAPSGGWGASPFELRSAGAAAG